MQKLQLKHCSEVQKISRFFMNFFEIFHAPCPILPPVPNDVPSLRAGDATTVFGILERFQNYFYLEASVSQSIVAKHSGP